MSLSYVNPSAQMLFSVIVFGLGFNVGGVASIISGVATSDLVIYFSKTNAVIGETKTVKQERKNFGHRNWHHRRHRQCWRRLRASNRKCKLPHLMILQIGLMQQKYGWNAIFIVLTITIYLSIIPLLSNFTKEIHEIYTIYKMKRRQAL